MLMRRFGFPSVPFYYLTALLSYDQFGFRSNEVLVRVNTWTGMVQLWQETRISWSSVEVTYHNLREYSEDVEPFIGPLPEHFYYQAA